MGFAFARVLGIEGICGHRQTLHGMAAYPHDITARRKTLSLASGGAPHPLVECCGNLVGPPWVVAPNHARGYLRRPSLCCVPRFYPTADCLDVCSLRLHPAHAFRILGGSHDLGTADPSLVLALHPFGRPQFGL